MQTLVKKQASARSAKDMVEQVLCTRSSFKGEATEGKGSGKKGSGGASKTSSSLLYGGAAFLKKASGSDGHGQAQPQSTKIEDLDDLWFYNAPSSKMCQHLLR